jgi:methyl coenzyme M reductase alpha subunit
MSLLKNIITDINVAKITNGTQFELDTSQTIKNEKTMYNKRNYSAWPAQLWRYYGRSNKQLA